MCGCKRNKQALTQVNPLKTAEQLVSEGVAVWAWWLGQPTTWRGYATNQRYPVNNTRCALLLIDDWNEHERRVAARMISPKFSLCTTFENALMGAKTKPVLEPAIVTQETTKLQPIAIEKPGSGLAGVIQAIENLPRKPVVTESSIVDITTLTVNDALPIIREAAEHTLNVWAGQENKRENGPRQMILTAISKRRSELLVEAGDSE